MYSPQPENARNATRESLVFCKIDASPVVQMSISMIYRQVEENAGNVQATLFHHLIHMALVLASQNNPVPNRTWRMLTNQMMIENVITCWTQGLRCIYLRSQLRVIQQKEINYQKRKLFHVEDVPEVNTETLIPMRVLFVRMGNIKITIIMMEVDLKLKIVKLAQLEAMLQELLGTAFLKECH